MYKVGEIITHNGISLRVEEGLKHGEHGCKGCYFDDKYCGDITCVINGKDIRFVEVKESGIDISNAFDGRVSTSDESHKINIGVDNRCQSCIEWEKEVERLKAKIRELEAK